MKLLHTADWHVGKTIKGQSRLGEHGPCWPTSCAIADTERVDVVLVAGDLYETAAPNPDAEALVLKTLLDLRDTGAQRRRHLRQPRQRAPVRSSAAGVRGARVSW